MRPIAQAAESRIKATGSFVRDKVVDKDVDNKISIFFGPPAMAPNHF